MELKASPRTVVAKAAQIQDLIYQMRAIIRGMETNVQSLQNEIDMPTTDFGEHFRNALKNCDMILQMLGDDIRHLDDRAFEYGRFDIPRRFQSRRLLSPNKSLFT
jgi:hypothetical protein